MLNLARPVSLLALLLLVSCSSTPTIEEQEEKAAKSTDQCLANPQLAKTWGECNVKTTIFRRADAIGQCQAKHGKSNPQTETLMLKIRLRPNGKVRNVWAEDGSAKNKPLERCLSQEISRLRFAAPPKGVDPVIYFPFQQ
jgi:hypothetical protein